MPIVKLVKGSQEAKDYMSAIRNKRKGKKSAVVPAPTAEAAPAPVGIEPITIVKRGKKKAITPL
jgi:hypothetical protein